MAQACPRCHGVRFERGRLDSPAPISLLMADGHRRAVAALVCADCGFVALVAARPGETPAPHAPGADVQEYDF